MRVKDTYYSNIKLVGICALGTLSRLTYKKVCFDILHYLAVSFMNQFEAIMQVTHFFFSSNVKSNTGHIEQQSLVLVLIGIDYEVTCSVL